ncbi:hypothetical protein RJ641_032948 [Dillenia turbinata]|uniref:Uncharacterized protein n=1 Tax=Dillenia turbinata TaxID=194707 RepID=A0AAN8VIY5_9MAGN
MTGSALRHRSRAYIPTYINASHVPTTSADAAAGLLQSEVALTAHTNHLMPQDVSSASCTTLLDSDSIAELASSSSKMGAFFSTTLAIAILCFWPGVKSTPLMPT